MEENQSELTFSGPDAKIKLRKLSRLMKINREIDAISKRAEAYTKKLKAEMDKLLEEKRAIEKELEPELKQIKGYHLGKN